MAEFPVATIFKNCRADGLHRLTLPRKAAQSARTFGLMSRLEEVDDAPLPCDHFMSGHVHKVREPNGFARLHQCRGMLVVTRPQDANWTAVEAFDWRRVAGRAEAVMQVRLLPPAPL